MPVRCNRRFFLAGAATIPLFARQKRSAHAVEAPQANRSLDIHVHLVGVGQGGTGCVLSPTIQQGPLFKLLTHKLGLRDRANTLDEAYVLALADQLQASGLTKCVLIGQDAVYDANGKPDWRQTHFYVPNDYVVKIAARYPDKMIPGASINPARDDALDELNRCHDLAVRVLKIHPPIQGVDISDKKYQPFFRRCAEVNMLVMVHTGHEHSAPVVNIDLARPAKLRQALDEGCTVVACHSGTGRLADQPDMLPEFLKMLREYEKAGTLWGDTAILGGLLRSRDFGRLLADDFAKSRLLHGSDFPFPAVPLEFASQIGAMKAAKLQLAANLLGQDLALKDALGIGQQSAERAYRLVCERAGAKQAE